MVKKNEQQEQKKKLTRKQAKFVDEYLICFNATKAARKAGYTDNELLHTNASKILQSTTVKEEIEERMKQAKLSAESVLKLLGDHATGNLEDFLTTDGEVDLDKAKQSGVLHLLREIEVTEFVNKDGSTIKRRIKLHDPQRALELMGKYYALFTDKTEATEKKIIHVTLKKEE